MRGHAHGLSAHGDKDVCRAETHRQVGRYPAAEPQAEVMAGPTMGRHACDPEFAVRAFGNSLRAQSQRLEDARYRPLRPKPQGGLCHWHHRQIASLADAETSCASLEFIA